MKSLKVLLVVGFVMVAVNVANASPTNMYVFGAISSADKKTCGVVGMKTYAAKSNPQLFTPDKETFRMLELNTKSYKNYSTPKKSGLFAIKYTCTIKNTSTPAPVKFFINSMDSYFLTIDQDTVGINP